jgi:hypothetical protein
MSFKWIDFVSVVLVLVYSVSSLLLLVVIFVVYFNRHSASKIDCRLSESVKAYKMGKDADRYLNTYC